MDEQDWRAVALIALVVAAAVCFMALAALGPGGGADDDGAELVAEFDDGGADIDFGVHAVQPVGGWAAQGLRWLPRQRHGRRRLKSLPRR